MLGREQLIEIVVAVAAVALMIGALIAVGTSFGTDGNLSAEGGTALVGVITGFVFLMTAVGVALAYALNDPADADADDANNAV